MPDPISAVGLLGLFNACLEGYKLCLAVKGANDDFAILRSRMFYERERFVNVCAALGLPALHSNGDKAGVLTRYIEHDEFRRRGIEGALQAIALLLARAEKADRKYSPPVGNAGAVVDKSAVQESISEGFNQIRHLLNRVPWSLRDKAAYEDALRHLAGFNESLEKVLPVAIQRFLDTVLPATVCASNEEGAELDLASLQQAAHTNNAFLASQIRWKNSVSEMGGIVLGTKLDAQSLNTETRPAERATDRYLAAPRSTPGHALLVDWLPWMEPGADVAARISRSSGLLADAQRPELLLLPCAGYLEEFSKRYDKVRYALTYKLPQDPVTALALSGKYPKAHSLRQFLQPKHNVMLPPLEARLDIARKLCRAMLLYHSSGWVHHDFRSHNIIFLQTSPVTTEITFRTDPSITTYQGVRIDQPFIVGFGHARDEFDISTAFQDKKSVSRTLEQQRLYWSPSYLDSSGQMRRAEQYQRKHDIYSLGCVMLEIGTWKSLEAFTWSSKYDENHQEWHQRLLQEFDKLRAMCGSRYAETVRTCLEYGGQVDGEADGQVDGDADGAEGVRVDVQTLAFDVLLRLEEIVA
ncbi:MAG: hypothetical protein M1825_001739 [Sarcosagium campestre]|nr:MAG: hypothetical protein M1825_001739 [Sarcosagium campestre]